jgi:hypothetical protein
MYKSKDITSWDLDLIIAADETMNPVIISNILAEVTTKIAFSAGQKNLGHASVDQHPAIRLLSARLLQISTNTDLKDFDLQHNYVHFQAMFECRRLRTQLFNQERGT